MYARYIITTLSLLFGQNLVFAQVLPQMDLEVETVETDQQHSVKIEVGAPLKPLANKGFRRDFTGILLTKISYNKKILKYFTVGPYFDYFSYDNAQSDSLRPSLKREVVKNGNYSTGINLGYEKVVGKKSMFNLITNWGYTWSAFERIDNTDQSSIASYQTEGTSLGLSLHWHYFIEGKFSVGPLLSYQITDIQYSPELLGFTPSTGGTKNQHLFWGFVLNFGF